MALELSNEMFINMRASDIPPWNPKLSYFEQSLDSIAFWENELRKCREGITIGGYYVHPWLYFHLNFFKTPIPTIDNMGKSVDKVQNVNLNDLMFFVIETYKEAEEKNNIMAMFGTRGSTKALKWDEKLLYEDGWRNICEVKVGDKIYGADGKLTNVLGVYPQGKVPLYRVTLRDGRSVVCCDEHLWYVYDAQARDYKTLPLKEIIKRYKYNRKYTGSKYKDGKDRLAEVYNYYIPKNDCVEYKEVELPICPYYLGLWLGDGHSRDSRVTNTDPEVISYLESFAKKHDMTLHRNDITYRMSVDKKSGNVSPITKALKDNNLIKNKHIPAIYLKASEEQRMELLRGLLDSDGTASLNGEIRFSQSRYELIKQVRELCLSLGIATDVRKVAGLNYVKLDGTKAESWNLVLYTDKDVFKIKRKSDRVTKDSKNNVFNRNHSSIIDITPVEPDEAYCIRVDNKDKLFLTTDFIVTHNSTVAASNAHWTTVAYGGGTYKVVGGSDGDLKDIGKLMKISFNNIEKPLFLPTLVADWSDYIEFGYKDKNINNGKRETHSDIVFTNVDGGSKNKSEKTAGGSPIGYLADEIGKYDFLGPLEAATPAFKANGQYRFVPILAGTSGNSVLSKEAKKVLSNPSAYEILPMNWDLLNRIVPEEFITWKEDIGKKFGTFMPGQMTTRLLTEKIPQPFDKFLGKKNKELGKIDIYVSDWGKISPEIEILTDDSETGKSTDKSKMYYPTKLDHIWLTDSPNPFPKEMIIKRIRELRESGRYGRPGKIVMKDGHNHFEFSDKKRAEVSHPGGPVDSPTILYQELPKTPPPPYMFAGGLDDYKTDTSDTDSLGAFYTLKRRNMDLNQPCETIALSYVSRPKEHKKLHEEIENNIEAFSAMTLMEYIDTTFETYLTNKNKDAKWLAPAMSFAASSKNKSKALQRKYGLPPTAGNNEHRFNHLVDWSWEQHEMDIDDSGNVIIKYGVEFIDDIDLLEEMLAYKKGGNFDRIVAFSHALLLCNHWDVNNVRVKGKNDKSKSIFSSNQSSEVKKKKVERKISAFTFNQAVRNPYSKRR